MTKTATTTVRSEGLTQWVVVVDGVVRGRYDCVIAATRDARNWGF